MDTKHKWVMVSVLVRVDDAARPQDVRDLVRDAIVDNTVVGSDDVVVREAYEVYGGDRPRSRGEAVMEVLDGWEWTHVPDDLAEKLRDPAFCEQLEQDLETGLPRKLFGVPVVLEEHVPKVVPTLGDTTSADLLTVYGHVTAKRWSQFEAPPELERMTVAELTAALVGELQRRLAVYDETTVLEGSPVDFLEEKVMKDEHGRDKQREEWVQQFGVDPMTGMPVDRRTYAFDVKCPLVRCGSSDVVKLREVWVDEASGRRHTHQCRKCGVLWEIPEEGPTTPTNVVEQGKLTMDVIRCARCGGDHPGLVFVAFRRPSVECQYWCSCPTTREPIFAVVGGVRKDEEGRD